MTTGLSTEGIYGNIKGLLALSKGLNDVSIREIDRLLRELVSRANAAPPASEQPAIPPHHSLNQRIHALEFTVTGMMGVLEGLTNDTETGGEDDGIKRVSIGPLGEFAVDRFRDRRGESWEEFAQAIVAEAVELGLVSRRESIDDPRLAPLVVTDGDAMEARRVYGQEYSLRDVLSDYANRVNEARGYTEEAA